jgi:hypothetical protein
LIDFFTHRFYDDVAAAALVMEANVRLRDPTTSPLATIRRPPARRRHSL